MFEATQEIHAQSYSFAVFAAANNTAATPRLQTLKRNGRVFSAFISFLFSALAFAPMFMSERTNAMPSNPDIVIRCLVTGICHSSDDTEASDEGRTFESMPLSGADIQNSTETPLELQPIGPIEPINPLAASACLSKGYCSRPGEHEYGNGEGFERISPQGASCAATASLKSLPSTLRQQLMSTSARNDIQICSKAVNNLAPMRSSVQSMAETNGRGAASGRLVEAASTYVQSCLSNNMLQSRGEVSSADQQFLQKHIGVIMLRRSLNWGDAQPICHAARLGRLVITAQHCVPSNSEAYAAGAGRTPEIGFRFLDNNTVFNLNLRKLGTKKGYVEERNRDFAILEIQNLPPNLEEDVDALVGKMELFGDFYNLTSNIYQRIASRAQGATELQRTAKIEHSLLCRPAHIAANGIFLHACQTESGVSGAPLFQRQNGRLVFVGIHNGVTSALDEPNLSSCKAGLPNYGITVPPEIINSISAR